MERSLEELEPNGWILVCLATGSDMKIAGEEWDSLRSLVRLAETNGRPMWWSGMDRFGEAIELRSDSVVGLMKSGTASIYRAKEIFAAEEAFHSDGEGEEWER